MKKTIVVFFLILFISSSSIAQIYKDFGIKLGTSIANQISSNAFFGGGGLRYKYGFTGGIFRETHIYEKLNIITGINYVQKGASDEFFVETNETGNYIGSDYAYRKLDFVSFELLCKYGGSSDKFSPYIIAGLRMDIFISGKKTFDILNKSMDSMLTSFYDFPLNNNKTFGGTFGLGLDYKPSKLLTIFVEGTFNPDFTSLGKYIRYGYEHYTKNYSFDIRTGIRF
jgi:hypothetical protein